jgi:hypothetical protein
MLNAPDFLREALSSPLSSMQYARDILKAPFPLGEPVIAQNPYYSYLYAKFVLKGPFPLGEPVIATDPYSSYRYAQKHP